MINLLLPCLLSLFFTHSVCSQETTGPSFQTFLAQSDLPLRPDGKIAIPEHFKHVKLDIGLSYGAPMSQYWLSHEEELVVFGFEPYPPSVQHIKNGATKRHPVHADPLEVKYVGKSFFLIPCALGLPDKPFIKFYVTKNDVGTCSVFEPTILEVEKTIEVPIYSLADFFDLFPFDTHPIIDYIKIDAQGSDLNIVKSAGHYLKDHVVFITIEAENFHYKNTINSENDIENYMINLGFLRYRSAETGDPTYFNPQFLEYVKTHPVKIYQNG